MQLCLKLMEAGETKTCIGYGKPPWKFKGSALYQLHLVKSEIARALIPKEFKLVEAFGYTLGGFFLAGYEDSPAGVFDELVVIAGTVWNPPTSCAWASKVLVNSNEACLHGRKEVGLPSHFARFTKIFNTVKESVFPLLERVNFIFMEEYIFLQRIRVTALEQFHKTNALRGMNGMGLSMPSSWKFCLDTEVTEDSGPSTANIFKIHLINAVPKENSRGWVGPSVKISLPSFSGRTEHYSNLLKYTCQMECRVRMVQPLCVLGPSVDNVGRNEDAVGHESSSDGDSTADKTKVKQSRLSLSVMLSKPILALEFNCLTMNVDAPCVISQ